MNSSTLVFPAWRRLLEELEKPNCLMPCNITMRRNPTYDMLNFALEYRKAIDILIANRQNELRAYELNEWEWAIARQLSKILEVRKRQCHCLSMALSSSIMQILKDATLFFSRSTPNLATVIPVMDFINDKLTAHAHDRTMSPAVKATLEIGKKTLNHYYSLTTSSEVCRIAMGMF